MVDAAHLYDPDVENELWDIAERQEQMFNTIRDQVSGEQVRRAIEVTQQHPHLPPGAVAAAAWYGLDDEQVQAMSVAAANQYGTDRTQLRLEERAARLDPNQALGSGAGKAMGPTLLKQFLIDEGQIDPDEIGENPFAQPEEESLLERGLGFALDVGGGVADRVAPAGSLGRGIVRGATTGFYSLWEELKARPLRAAVTALDQQGVNPARFALESAGSFLPGNPVAASQLMPSRNRVDPAQFMQDFGSNWIQAGTSPGAMAISQALRGENVDLGDGLLPGGSIMRQHIEQAESMTYRGTPISAGRVIAHQVFEPGTKPFNLLSGGLDFADNVLFDPADLAGAGIADIARQSTRVGDLRTSGLIQSASRKGVDVDTAIDTWLHSARGQRLRQWLVDETDFDRVRQAIGGDAEIALRLADATDDGRVMEIMSNALGRTLDRVSVPGRGQQIARSTIDRVHMNRVWEAARNAIPQGVRETAAAPFSVIGNWTPRQSIRIGDTNDSVEQFNRWMRNARFGRDTRTAFSREMAEALVRSNKDGNFGRVWEVYRRANEELRGNLLELGHDRQVVDRLTAILGNEDFRRADRAYWLEQTVGARGELPGPANRPGLQIDGDGVPVPTPHLSVELMDLEIPLHNIREIRRATDTMSRVANVLNGTPGTALSGIPASGLLGKTQRGAYNTIDALWWLQRAVWTPMQLVTRVAWPMRITMEEQARMAASGYDSMFRHPLSQIGWVVGRKGDMKIADFGEAAFGGFTRERIAQISRGEFDLPGAPLDLAEQFQMSQVRNALPRSFIGDDPRMFTGDWTRLNTKQAQRSDAITAWGIEMDKLWSAPESVRVAQGMVAGNLSEVRDWFWSGGGRAGRESMSANLLHNGRVARHLDTRIASDEFINSVRRRIIEMTGGDRELIQAISEQSLRGSGVGSMANRVPRQKIRSILHEKADGGRMPEFLPAPRSMVDPSRRQAWQELADGAVAQLWYWLGGVPSNKLSRSPLFRQTYWRRVAELTPWMDEATLNGLESVARAERLPGYILEDMAQARKVASGDPGQLVSFTEVDQLAKTHALETTNGLLYDLTERGQTADVLRLVFPFAEAWKEILSTWARIFAQNPVKPIRRGQQIVEGARDSGFFFEDPVSGDEMFVYNMIPGFGRVNVDRLFGQAAEGEDVQAAITGRVAGVNLFSATLLPGFGPAVTVPSGAMLPHHPKFDYIRDVLMPFGSEFEKPSDLADPGSLLAVALPAWMEKLLSSFEGGIDERLYNSHAGDVLRALVASGEFDAQTPEGRSELEQAALEGATATVLVRALGQAIAPTGPAVDFQIAVENPEKLRSEMERLFGEELRLGPQDGNFFSSVVLGSLWHKLNEESGDPYVATSTFLQLVGRDPDDYYDQLFAGSLRQGKTQSIEKRATTDAGRAWERANSELIERFPQVVGYFAPEETTPDSFSLEAFFSQISEGARIQLDPEQMIQLINKKLGTQIYRHQRELTEGRSDEQSRAWLAGWRAYLDEQFPGWRDEVVGILTPATIDQKIDQLDEALDHPVIAETPAGQAANEYMTHRDQVLATIMEEQGFPDRRQAEQRLRSANAEAPRRQWLFEWGTTLVGETGEFAPIWNELLAFEVEGAQDG